MPNPDNFAIKTTRPLFNIKNILLYILVGALGFLIGKVFFDYILPKSKKNLLSRAHPTAPLVQETQNLMPAQAPIQQSAEPVQKTTPAQKSQPVEKQSGNYPELNGIFFSKDEGFCLINNRIAKEGDTVEGITIKQINPDSIEAEIGGRTVKLRSPSR
ncbi:MAG: hypothetical protein NC916_03225 [Candidatus Omnitrophica bacterium]|nr:hypothetical protein [Candidatus Omnitrophota bacterium]